MSEVLSTVPGTPGHSWAHLGRRAPPALGRSSEELKRSLAKCILSWDVLGNAPLAPLSHLEGYPGIEFWPSQV